MSLRKGAYEMILAGRHPGAVARLHGTETCEGMEGEVAFYTTPLGVVVCAEVSGLPDGKPSEAFGLSIGEEDPTRKRLNVIPPLSARKGRAWCAVMTGGIRVSEILGETLRVRSGDASFLGEGRITAPTTMCGVGRAAE